LESAMAEQRIPICSAKRDNRVLGYIEGSEAFDLFGRRRADYNPNTGLLYGLRDGGVVGYVTFDSKFAGLSRMVDEMFPKTYEVIPQQSPKDYVNNLVVETQAGEQANEDSGRRDAEYDFSMREIKETPVSAPPLQHEPGATFFLESHDGAYQQTRPSERCSNEPDLGVTGARQGDAENELVSSINQTASPPLVEHDEAPTRTPLPKAHDASPDEGAESERASSDSRALGVVETFMQCVAEYVHSNPNDTKETPSPPPSRQDEVPNLDSNFDLMDTHRERLRGDGFAVGPGESFVEREAQDDTFSSTNESPASSQQDEEAETNFFSVSDDNNPSQDDLRGERSSEARGSLVADASFGKSESGDEANSVNQTPSPSLSENGERAGADLDSKSGDNSPEEHGPGEPCAKGHGPLVKCGEVEAEELYSINEESDASVSERDEEAGVNPDSKSDDHIFSREHVGDHYAERLSPLGAGNSLGDAVSGDEFNSISYTPGELLSGQDEAQATLLSEPADGRPQENFESELDANRTDVVVGVYIVGQRDDGDSAIGIEEKPNLPSIEQKEAEQSLLSNLNDETYQQSAASGQYLEGSPFAPPEPGVPTPLPGQQSAHDVAKDFFEIDLERAVAMVRSELAKSGHGVDPTADFFSVDLERAVDIVRKEFETKV
jgi:hypothetical protein